VASTFVVHSKKGVGGRPTIVAPKMKLLQFLAVRPWLLPVLRRWSRDRSDPQRSLFFSERLRRGFLGDTMHDDLVTFLVARGVFYRAGLGRQLVAGINYYILAALHEDAVKHGLFTEERDALEKAKAVPITEAMLEGW